MVGPVSAKKLEPNCVLALFNRLDDVVHQRTRLGLLCVLSVVEERDFNGLRRDLHLSDGNLARHITVLRAADLVEADQRLTPNHRRRTFLRLTELGRRTLDAELAMLAQITAEFRPRASAVGFVS